LKWVCRISLSQESDSPFSLRPVAFLRGANYTTAVSTAIGMLS
jgi:hypothetical protein